MLQHRVAFPSHCNPPTCTTVQSHLHEFSVRAASGRDGLAVAHVSYHCSSPAPTQQKVTHSTNTREWNTELRHVNVFEQISRASGLTSCRNTYRLSRLGLDLTRTAQFALLSKVSPSFRSHQQIFVSCQATRYQFAVAWGRAPSNSPKGHRGRQCSHATRSKVPCATGPADGAGPASNTVSIHDTIADIQQARQRMSPAQVQRIAGV